MTSFPHSSEDAAESIRRWRERTRSAPGYASASEAVALIRPGRRGRDARARRFPPAGIFQPYGATEFGRYPEEFEAVSETMLNAVNPRMLSFGCSTGEELMTILERWPGATIRGLDANPQCVRSATRLLRAHGTPPGVSVAVAADASHEQSGSFDVVFAMAVFRHGDLGLSPSCAPLLHFVDVNRVLTSLVDVLRPGGLLVLRHANVRLGDTSLAQRFERVAGEGWLTASPIYGPDNRLRSGVAGDDGVFRLLS